MLVTLTDHQSPKWELSAEGRRHLKILINWFSETFPAFLRDLGTKMQDFRKCGFLTTVAGRRVSEFKCGSDLHDAGHLGSMYFFSAFNSPASVDEYEIKTHFFVVL